MIDAERPGPGIPRTLARSRSRAVKAPDYELRLSLPASPDGAIDGLAMIDLTLEKGEPWPVLDFLPPASHSEGAISSLTVDGNDQRFRHRDGHLSIEGPAASAGRHRISIRFSVPREALHHRTDLAYTLFVPAAAHRLFPCFDQPDLKASLSLELELPDAWQAVANAPDTSRRPAANGRQTVRFAPTEPLPTYLYAFAAGRLDAIAPAGARPGFRVWHATGHPITDRQAEEIGRLHAAALDFLETYTATRYPFRKLECVLIPDFQFSGMEHAGAIFYRDSLMRLDSDATETDLRRRAHLIAHETAHMWFGNLVTMTWFDDVWLKEVFANLLADRILARLFPDDDHQLEFFLQHYPPAYAIDRTAGTHPIRQSLDNLADAAELYDAIIYHKAPIAMASLERRIGKSALRHGIRRYLDAHRFGHADWPALLRTLESESADTLADWSRCWIETAGPPDATHDQGSVPYRRIDRAAPAPSLDRLSSTTPLQRAVAWTDLFERMLDGDIAPTRLIEAAASMLRAETSQSLVTRLIHDLAGLVWRFVLPGQRLPAARLLEQVIDARLEASGKPSDAARWLRFFAQLATTPNAASRLETLIGDPENAFPEALRVQVTLTLSVLVPARADEFIDRQRTRMTDAANAEKLESLAPAVSSEPGEREATFGRLVDGAYNPRRTLEILSLLCHPRHADTTIRWLERGLAHAAHCRGDIFFPRQWLTALFSGQGTADAARIIDGFLTAEDPPPYIRRLILETADPVYRAAAIRERSASR
jgi:aminopeptidase N